MRELAVKYKVDYSLNFLAGSVLLLLTAFPYLQLIQFGSYTQPYSLMLAILLFPIMAWSVLSRLGLVDQIALIGLALSGIIIFIITGYPYVNFQEFKYLISYVTPILLTVPILFYLNKYNIIAIKILRISVSIWLAVAVIQKLINPNFLVFLIGQWGESVFDIVESGRGVLGLAPEPTHHAFHILLLGTCLALLDAKKQSRWLVIFCVIDAVVLAASASAILVLSMSAIIWSILYRQRLIFYISIIILLIFGFGIIDKILVDTNVRITQLIIAVLKEPMSVLTLDYSMNVRLGGLFAVVITTLSHALAPFGMSLEAWEIARERMLNDLPWLIDLSSVGPPSGIGQLLFQAGFLGAIFICIIFRRILSFRVGGFEKILLITTPLIFLSQYYISSPTFSLLYACALYRWSKEKNFTILNKQSDFNS
jgi:hypothetical protein